MEVVYGSNLPPLSAIAAASVGNVHVSFVSELPDGSSMPQLTVQSGEKLLGLNTILRYIGRCSTVSGFYGVDPVSASEVDEWVDYAQIFTVGAEFENSCSYVNTYLELRTFLVGYNTTLADITIWCGLAGKQIEFSPNAMLNHFPEAGGQRWESMRRAAKYPHLTRWFDSVLADHPILEDIVSRYVGKRGLGKAAAVDPKPVKSNVKQTQSQKVEGSFEVNLPEAEMGKVCTRFPPEPSGFLHIGHAKAALLNEYFARKYNGKLLVRFDDTNPSKEKDEFVQNILQDLETLQIKYDAVTYTSDYFEGLLQMAEKLIREGKAYVDDTPRDTMKNERMEGIESKCRNKTVDENILLWKEMIQGTERGQECCLRGKLDMQALNKTLRDPVYYRSNPVPHHRVGKLYNVYPTYDFACPYVDSIEGITHALRSSEYHDRNEQYYKVLADMGLRKVHLWDFSRLNFVYTLLSKRKLQWFVDNGLVEGWDDPRFPTVQGIRRRGLTVEALRRFILSQGASKNLNLMEWDKLWAINKQIIDPICPRHTAVISEGKVLLTLRDGPETPFVRIIPRHKKFPGAGEKSTTYCRSIWLDRVDAQVISCMEEVTLMDWGNAIVEKIEKDDAGIVRELYGVLHLDGSVKTTKLKLTWLADHSELVSLLLVDLDYLITKEKMEEDDEVSKVLNPVTRTEIEAVGDSNMRNLKKGEIIQVERKGYYICDVPYVRSSSPIVLINIPDGKNRRN